jgi:NAD(P)H dehydrogenase (quinone)
VGQFYPRITAESESVLDARQQDYGHAGQMTLDEVIGGSPYGASTVVGTDGSRQPFANELTGARYQGRKVVETATKLWA